MIFVVSVGGSAYGVCNSFASLSSFNPAATFGYFGYAARGMFGLFIGGVLIYLGAIYYPANSVLGAVTDITSEVSTSVESEGG